MDRLNLSDARWDRIFGLIISRRDQRGRRASNHSRRNCWALAPAILFTAHYPIEQSLINIKTGCTPRRSTFSKTLGESSVISSRLFQSGKCGNQSGSAGAHRDDARLQRRLRSPEKTTARPFVRSDTSSSRCAETWTAQYEHVTTDRSEFEAANARQGTSPRKMRKQTFARPPSSSHRRMGVSSERKLEPRTRRKQRVGYFILPPKYALSS